MFFFLHKSAFFGCVHKGRCLATEGLDDRKREYDLGWYAYMHILTLHTCSMHSAYMHNESKCSQQCTHWLAAQSASESRVPMGYILPSKRKSNFIVHLRMPNATFISDIYTPFFSDMSKWRNKIIAVLCLPLVDFSNRMKTLPISTKLSTIDLDSI